MSDVQLSIAPVNSAQQAKSGQRLLTDDTEHLNAMEFLIRMALGRMWTSTLAKVEAVHGGGLGPPPTVDVTPCVDQMDSEGVITPHQTIYGLPVARSQGGSSAEINDPVVGDIGVIVFASRDISSVKVNGGPANPGSYRRFDAADGVYVRTVLGATPQQYVQYLPNNGGINIVSPGPVTINGVIISPQGFVTAPEDVIAGGPLAAGGVSLQNHLTPTAPSGPESPPQPGT
jgi:hypothetical protein